jgi:hypothetical protein
MPGVFEVPPGTPVVRVIDDILLVAECGIAEDLSGQVLYLPL